MRSRHKWAAVAVPAMMAALAAGLTACGSGAAGNPGMGGSPSQSQPAGAAFGWFHPGAAPAAWRHATLSAQGAVLSYPPSLRAMEGDPGTVSVGLASQSGRILVYLNVTSRQGDESLRDWPGFRVSHLREEGQRAVHADAASSSLAFRDGNGRCVIDDYITKAHNNHYREIACFVQAARGATVLVAATPTGQWRTYGSLLEQAVSTYQAG